jgi:hypothetical protein
MKRTAIITDIGKIKMSYMTESEVQNYLKDEKFQSISVDDEYYIFLDKSIDSSKDEDMFSLTLYHTNKELMNLVQIDKEKNRGVGRPKVELDSNVEKVLDEYFQCKIGTSEAKEKIKLTPKNNGTWRRLLNEYKAKHKIIDCRNNVDNFANNPKMTNYDDMPIGFITLSNNTKYRFYLDGSIEEIQYTK